MAYFAAAAGAGIGLSAVILTMIVYQAAQTDRMIVGLLIAGAIAIAFFAANAIENAAVALLSMRAGQLGAGAVRGQAPDMIDLQARQAQTEWTIERARREARRDQPRALPAWAAGGVEDDDEGVVL